MRCKQRKCTRSHTNTTRSQLDRRSDIYRDDKQFSDQIATEVKEYLDNFKQYSISCRRNYCSSKLERYHPIQRLTVLVRQTITEGEPLDAYRIVSIDPSLHRKYFALLGKYIVINRKQRNEALGGNRYK